MKIKNLYIYAFLLLIILFIFWPMYFVFYQQDEWRALGSYFAQSSFLDNFKNFNLAKIVFAEGRLFSVVLGYFLLGKFPFNTTPLFIYTIGFHFLNTCLVYILARKFINNNFLSLLAGIFFGISSISVGAVTWYGSSIGTLPATTMILLAAMTFLKALDSKHKKYFLISFILLYISQYFKEIGYFFFLGFPVIAFFYKKYSFKMFIETFWYFFVTFIIIAVFRYLLLASYNAHTAVFTSQASNNFLFVMLTRAILYPLTSFFLVYIPPEYLLFIAKKFTNIYYPFFPAPQYDLLIQSVVGDLIALTGSIVILISLYLISQKKDLRKIVFLIVLALASYLPYIILSKDYTYLDSRYYYLGAAPAGLLVSFFLIKIKEQFKKIFYYASWVFFIGYLFMNAILTKEQIEKLSDVSQERSSVLKQLSTLNPKLDDRNIFYISGDKDFYLSQGNKLPFQQGTGYTLLTWYGRSDKRFNDFLDQGLLWNLGSQGYYQNNKIGFGFFWDKKELLKVMDEKQLTIEDVIYLYYDSNTKNLSRLDSRKI